MSVNIVKDKNTKLLQKPHVIGYLASNVTSLPIPLAGSCESPVRNQAMDIAPWFIETLLD